MPRHAALGLREAPGVGFFHVEGGVLDVHASPVVGNRSEPRAGAPGRAVVEAVDHRTAGVETVDQAAVEIRDEELPARSCRTRCRRGRRRCCRGWSRTGTPRRSGRRSDRCCRARRPCRCRTGRPSTARRAVPSSSDPDGHRRWHRGRRFAGRMPRSGRHRCSASRAVVERDRQTPGPHRARALEGRLRGNDLALRRCAGRAEPEDLRRRSVEVDVEHVERVGARRIGASGALMPESR